MSEKRWGSRIVCGFSGTRGSDPGVVRLRERLESGEATGVVLFSYNIESPAQLIDLIAEMRSWQRPQVEHPLLVMVDQEGGRVQRLTAKKGFQTTRSAAALSKLPPEVVREEARAMAEQLAAIGINVNLAPCCDMASQPESVIGKSERSFGGTLTAVASYARVFVEEHARVGVASVIKHFPGLGGARGDTHAGLIDATADWDDQSLAPFQQLMDLYPSLSVMSTHMVNRILEPSGMPLTFSRDVMHNVLRQQMRSRGVLMTDDLDMGAMRHHYDFETTVYNALHAGHDLLVFGENEAALGDGRAPNHVTIDQLYVRVSQAAQKLLESEEFSVWWDESEQRLLSWRRQLTKI